MATAKTEPAENANVTPSIVPETIFMTINRVMQKVNYLQKDKSLATGPKYSYLSEEKIVGELHQECTDAGLVIVPINDEILSDKEWIVEKNGFQSIIHNVKIKTTFLVANVFGESIQITGLGEGSDSQDKCCNKAMTGALKYALRRLFLIATGNDPDDTASEPSFKATTPAAPAAPKAAPVVPPAPVVPAAPVVPPAPIAAPVSAAATPAPAAAPKVLTQADLDKRMGAIEKQALRLKYAGAEDYCQQNGFDYELLKTSEVQQKLIYDTLKATTAS